MFAYDSNSYSGKQKRKGYQDAVEKYGLTTNELFVPFKETSIEKTKELILEKAKFLREEGHYPDAMICCEDAIAAAAVKVAYEIGVAIPSQLNIIGYNNSILATCCLPELTSIDNKVKEVCENAIKMLMQVLEGKEIEPINVVSCLIEKRCTTNF